jgi:hypothetical protein
MTTGSLADTRPSQRTDAPVSSLDRHRRTRQVDDLARRRSMANHPSAARRQLVTPPLTEPRG